MVGWTGDIEAATTANDNFRKVLFTAAHLQLVVMSLRPGEEIGVEMHDHLEQFIRVEAGNARVTLGPSKDDVSEAHDLGADDAVIVPGGTWHNVVNTGGDDLKLYTIYAPPEHPEGTVHATKAEADAAEEDHS
jgi:mannose-6-phosphate isomerase-like protein (cupin superfamily)